MDISNFLKTTKAAWKANLEVHQKKLAEEQQAVREAEAAIADLDKAISALTPEDGNDVLLADQQDTPPQSNAQASETDAAGGDSETVEFVEEEYVKVPPENDETCCVCGAHIPAGSMIASCGEDGWYCGDIVHHRAIAEAPTADERPSVVTDHDRVEQTNTDTVAAVEIPEDDEPKEEISTLTGDPAIEPESGLHGEPLPPSELDSQAQPQTKSEQSEIFHPDAPTWNAGFEEDRKPKPGFIEGAVSGVAKLFKGELV